MITVLCILSHAAIAAAGHQICERDMLIRVDAQEGKRLSQPWQPTRLHGSLFIISKTFYQGP